MKIWQKTNRVPLASAIARFCYQSLYGCFRVFPGSQKYWEHRYAKKGNSGAGSFGRLGEFKAQIINQFVRENDIKSVIEFGCGDGSQLSLAAYPEYIGLDVSPTAIELCQKKFPGDLSKKFFLLEPLSSSEDKYLNIADLALSLDVIYHLTEDEVYRKYMKTLFDSAKKYAIIYSSNHDENQSYHIKHREFTRWIQQNARDWQLIKRIDNAYPYDASNPENTSWSDFYIFKKSIK